MTHLLQVLLLLLPADGAVMVGAGSVVVVIVVAPVNVVGLVLELEGLD